MYFHRIMRVIRDIAPLGQHATDFSDNCLVFANVFIFVKK